MKTYSDFTNPIEQNKYLEDLIKANFDQELKEKIAHRLDTEHGITKVKTKRRKFRILPFISGIAASLLILFLYNGLNQTSDIQNNSIIMETFNQKITHPGLTKGAQSADDLRISAITAFNSQDFQEAIHAFNGIENATNEDLYYKAMSSFYLEDFQKANQELQALLDIESSFYQEVRWFLAISEIKLNDLSAAKLLLNEIKANEWNYEKSQELLKSLN